VSRRTCQNCGARYEAPEAPPPVVEPIDPGIALDVPVGAQRKPIRLVALLWAACRPGGVTRTEASRIVAPELDPDGPSGLRKLRRYVRDLDALGFVVEKQADPFTSHPGARVLSLAVLGVDFHIWRMR